MLFLFGLYVVVPALQVFYFVSGQPFFSTADFIDFIASIVMFHWMMNSVLLSAKIPVLQKKLPYDQRIRWHILGNIGLIGLFLFHVIIKFLAGKLIDPVSWILLVLFGTMTLVSLLWIPLPSVKYLRAWIINGLRFAVFKSYDLLKKVHNLLFLAVAAFTYWHVLWVHVFDQIPSYSILAYNVVFFGAAGVWFIAALRGRFLPKVRIESITKQGGIHIIRFQSNRALRYYAGQFAFLTFDHPALKGEHHPFSFLSSPNDRHISFGVKILGDFTSSLNLLKAGDTARINAGFGNFRLYKDKHPVFIGSGIGAVPFVSLLKDLQAQGDQRKIDFHLAVNSDAEIPDAPALYQLKHDLPNLKLELIVNERDPRLYSYEYFHEQIRHPSRHTYYICSSPGVRKIIVQALKRLGVKSRAIRFESFSFS